MRLFIVRHGESTANRDHLVLGQSLDVCLTDRGQAQAEAAAEKAEALVGRAHIQIFSSDATRALLTAQAIWRRIGADVEPTALLREQSLGDLEGRPAAELQALPTPPGVDISEVSWGGGESIAQTYQRMKNLVEWLKTQIDSSTTVILVGHSHALCAFQALAAGRSYRDIDWDGDVLANGEVRELDPAVLIGEK